MSYSIEVVRPPRKKYYSPSEARSYYGRYSRDSITYHWFNFPEHAGTHDNTVKWLRDTAEVSINYVVSDAKITSMVPWEDVAFHAKSGNPTSIGIEFHPSIGAEGYRKGGWLINEIEKLTGKTLPIRPHSYWVVTSCPGVIDGNRLRKEANSWKNSKNIKETTMINESQLNDLYRLYLRRSPDASASKRYLGKMTYDQVKRELLRSNEYKRLVDTMKRTKEVSTQHLVRDFRNALSGVSTLTPKGTAQPPANVQTLSKGIYEVK